MSDQPAARSEGIDEANPHADAADANATAGSDRPPTEDEIAAAQRAEELDPEVAKNYGEAIERGAGIAGEGSIDG